MRGLDVVAVIAVRNEAAYIRNVLHHLKANDIRFAVIDNDSTDDTVARVLDERFASHLVALRTLPFQGAFDLGRQLREKMALIEALDADWVIHLDADEILHPYKPGQALKDAIAEVDEQGCNVIEFDEFVFLPIEANYIADHYSVQPIATYYHMAPRSMMRAWRRDSHLSMVESGGHRLKGVDIRLSSTRMAMRHYMFRDQDHAFRKYAERNFCAEELARGWHRRRHQQAATKFAFPPADLLHRLDDPASLALEVDQPRSSHYWQWPDQT